MASTSPHWLAVVPEAIPDELKEPRQWVCWRAALRDEKWTKVPYRRNGQKADVTDETTWTTFARVLKAYIEDRYDGIGFVLTKDDPYTFIDLDKCVSIDGDRIEPWAVEYFATLGSYTEVSPSGMGLRIVVKAKLPEGRRREGSVEMYDNIRFCTFTGVMLEHVNPRIESRQAEVEELHRKLFANAKMHGTARGDSDENLITQAKEAANGSKFERLWSGDFSEYESQSEADQALANMLVFWTEGDTLRADRLFRSSSLMRPKWGEQRGADTYGRLTLANAFELWRQNQRPTYSTPRPAKVVPDAEGVWTTARLLRTHFPEMQWIVDEFIPEDSLTILGGKKKVGKSWLARQIAGAVSCGDGVLGRKTLRGHVLFYCLEDGKRRLRKRLQLQEASEEEDTEYAFKEDLPTLDDGGMDILRTKVQTTHPLLTVIDTLAAAKSGKIDENAAGPMADMINALQQMCQEEHTAILLVAHHGKSSFGDSGHDIRGSSAIAAAADVNLALYRKHDTDDTYTLNAEGRDIAEGEFRLEFEDYRFKLRGEERSLSAQEADEEVYNELGALGESEVGSIATATGRSRQGVMTILKRLAKVGRVQPRTVRLPGQPGRPHVLWRVVGDWTSTRYDLND